LQFLLRGIYTRNLPSSIRILFCWLSCTIYNWQHRIDWNVYETLSYPIFGGCFFSLLVDSFYVLKVIQLKVASFKLTALVNFVVSNKRSTFPQQTAQDSWIGWDPAKLSVLYAKDNVSKPCTGIMSDNIHWLKSSMSDAPSISNFVHNCHFALTTVIMCADWLHGEESFLKKWEFPWQTINFLHFMEKEVQGHVVHKNVICPKSTMHSRLPHLSNICVSNISPCTYVFSSISFFHFSQTGPIFITFTELILSINDFQQRFWFISGPPMGFQDSYQTHLLRLTIYTL
jgi:hypothetical protein